MKIIITIYANNDSFTPDPGYQTAELLEDLAMYVSQEGTLDFHLITREPYHFVDNNGNPCGNIRVEEEGNEPGFSA